METANVIKETSPQTVGNLNFHFEQLVDIVQAQHIYNHLNRLSYCSARPRHRCA
jgi:hypothetical protein